MNKKTVDKVFENFKGNDMFKDPLINMVKNIFHNLGDGVMDKDLADVGEFKSHMKNDKSPHPSHDSIRDMGDNIRNLINACETGNTEDIESALVLEVSSIKQDILNFALSHISHNPESNETAKHLLTSMTELRKQTLINIAKSDNDELLKYILEDTNLVDFQDEDFKHKIISKTLKVRKYDTINYLLNVYKDKV